ncbi:hypothetical protein CCH79_00006932 [Gambusia affinis]|uniref:Centromere protein H C-terminal domain-containing protein n=1 Tax=Gambusia affinis TaxID=33528 RepID=A0A315V8A0_GAMAF|nr:hypothetical protein CCH79_00006932 [Gambusia affinis]
MSSSSQRADLKLTIVGKSKRPCSTSQAERELPDCISELERVKTAHFNSTLALHRIQMWNAIGEKMKQTDPDATQRPEGRECSLHGSVFADKTAPDIWWQRLPEKMNFISQFYMLFNRRPEICKTKLQKYRRRDWIKRLTHEKMKETQKLLSNKEHPDSEKYKAVLEKGQENLEIYKKMTIMAQNVLRGILLACKVNWLDEPNLREIVMTLEDFPISD